MEEEEGKFGNFSANVAKLYVLLFIQFAGDKSGRKPCYIYCTLEKTLRKLKPTVQFVRIYYRSIYTVRTVHHCILLDMN